MFATGARITVGLSQNFVRFYGGDPAETATGSALPSPPLGRHSDEVLQECGLSATEIAQLREAGAVA